MQQDTRIRRILEQLEEVQEDLRALSDDIWLNINHNDNEEIRRNVEFKIKYNEAISTFESAASVLKSIVEEYTGLDVSDTGSGVNLPQPREIWNEREIRMLDPTLAHTLDEDFTYKRPFAVEIGDKQIRDVRTWKQIYKVIGKELSENDSERFYRLPTEDISRTRRGNLLFSRTRDGLREPLQLCHGVFAEANLSANYIRDNMLLLLKYMNLPKDSVRIYLRQDRDAGSEK